MRAYEVAYQSAKARELARLLKQEKPTQLQQMDIDRLVRELGVYGETLKKVREDYVKYGSRF